jgi:HSP20 family protein
MNALSTYSPIRDFGFLPSRLFNLAETLFGDTTGVARTWSPAVNVAEDANGYQISADLPDVAIGDVKVVVREGVLTLSGERKRETKTEGVKYHLVERTTGTFQRSFSLPKDANGEKVSAEFKNGVLLVTVPKREEVKPREIEVKVK